MNFSSAEEGKEFGINKHEAVFSRCCEWGLFKCKVLWLKDTWLKYIPHETPSFPTAPWKCTERYTLTQTDKVSHMFT